MDHISNKVQTTEKERIHENPSVTTIRPISTSEQQQYLLSLPMVGFIYPSGCLGYGPWEK